MVKSVDIQVVESISNYVAEMEDRIRTHAFEKYLMRESNLNRELDDWLEAERELTSQLLPTVSQEDNRIVAEIQVNNPECEELIVRVTPQELFVSAVSSTVYSLVVRFPQEIDPSGAEAEYLEGTLRVVAPLPDAQVLRKSA